MLRVAIPPPPSVPEQQRATRLFRAVFLSFHLWDLDAPSVALSWQFLFARYVHVTVSWAAALALALAVWLIYVGDRLLDIRRSGGIRHTPRHAFHLRHSKLLTVLASVALVLLVAISVFLRPVLIESGLTLAACVALYLACVHLSPGPPRRWFPKELVVGLMFAAGACLAPWSRAPHPFRLLLPGLFFAALCCINCVLIEVWEWRDSGASGSAPPHAWSLWLWRAMRPLLLAIAASSACLAGLGLSRLFAAVLLSCIAILMLDRFKNALSTDARRVLADAALLTPLLFLIR